MSTPAASGGRACRDPGHSVLVIPVPELEEFVRARWVHYDASWVSTDTEFTHAHITALAPYLSAPTAADLTRVGEIAATVEPFDFVLEDVAVFPNGCVHVPPVPREPFDLLTKHLIEAFPMCPPYAGEYDAVPHLTLDQLSASVTLAGTRAALAPLLPVSCRADRLQLHWYEQDNCHVQHTWHLGC